MVIVIISTTFPYYLFQICVRLFHTYVLKPLQLTTYIVFIYTRHTTYDALLTKTKSTELSSILLLDKRTVTHLVQKLSLFMDPIYPLPCLQVSASGFCKQLIAFRPHLQLYFSRLYFKIKFPSDRYKERQM